MSMESSTTRTTACIHLSGRDSDVTVTDCQMGNKGESGSLSYFCHPQLTVKACRLAVSVTDQNSFLSLVSSIVISLNSLESKTSPHSRHSTNSASSSRATTRTRGCLQIFSIVVFSEGCFAIGDVWIGFIFGSRRISPAPLSNSGYFYAGIAACQAIFQAAGGRLCASVSAEWMKIPETGLLLKAWDKCRNRGPAGLALS